MPKLAAFPKAQIEDLVVTGRMRLREWIELAATLDIEGLEMYSGMLDLQKSSDWGVVRRMAADQGLEIPMLCCSPDFTHPDPAFRKQEIEREKHFIEMAGTLGAGYCRILSGQRRPEVSIADGLQWCVECFLECLDHASMIGVTLVLENHYKDNFWTWPEFAQKSDVFCALIHRINHPGFGVNFDPSNTLLAGEDPIELLRKVLPRVRTMHASDRYLAEGSLEDLRREENVEGYARRLRHGEIGKGLNDYPTIFRILREGGFDGWISIEDGVEGFDQMHRSVGFLRRCINEVW